MNSNFYESLNNEKDESSGDDGNSMVYRKEKSSLRIRLNRVFSSGSLRSPMSPGPFSSLSNSRGSSPIRSSSSSNSPCTKFRYSWQTSGLGNKQDNRSPQRSPRPSTPVTPGTPKKSLPTRLSDSSSSPASPATPKSPGNAAIWYDGERMKYSPQQQQKERKSESDSMNATPSRNLENRTRSSTGGDTGHEDLAGSSTASRFSISRTGSSTGMFAWMRVFRLATMLHQVGC